MDALKNFLENIGTDTDELAGNAEQELGDAYSYRPGTFPNLPPLSGDRESPEFRKKLAHRLQKELGLRMKDSETINGCAVSRRATVAQLKEYQLGVAYMITREPAIDSLLVVHDTGAGKTLTLLAAAEELVMPTGDGKVSLNPALVNGKIVVIAPNTDLHHNIRKEAAKSPGPLGEALRAMESEEERTRLVNSIFEFFTYVRAGNSVPFGPNGQRSAPHSSSGAAQRSSGGNNWLRGRFIICDEAHHAANNKYAPPQWKGSVKRVYYGIKDAMQAPGTRCLALTATPVVESFKDVVALVEMLRRVDGPDGSPRPPIQADNERLDLGIIGAYCSVYSVKRDYHLFPAINAYDDDSMLYPRPIHVYCPMHPAQQLQIYEKVWGRKPPMSWGDEKGKPPVSKPETAGVAKQDLEKIRNEVIKIATAHSSVYQRVLDARSKARSALKAHPTLAPKILACVQRIISRPDRKHLVMSHFKARGLAVAAAMLEELGYEPFPITKPKSWSELKPGVKRYLMMPPSGAEIDPESKAVKRVIEWTNRPENSRGQYVSVLLVQIPKFGEGIDYKAIRSLYILEPPSDIRSYIQYTGRVKRYCSHAALPEAEWKVRLYMFFTDNVPMRPELVNMSWKEAFAWADIPADSAAKIDYPRAHFNEDFPASTAPYFGPLEAMQKRLVELRSNPELRNATSAAWQNLSAEDKRLILLNTWKIVLPPYASGKKKPGVFRINASPLTHDMAVWRAAQIAFAKPAAMMRTIAEFASDCRVVEGRNRVSCKF